jgi:radical SAM superfamily enzyme YgiQ (UPF0313 family)
MKIYLADLVHTYSVRDNSLLVPLNIGYIKAYAVQEHGPSVDIRLFKHPEKLLTAVYEEEPAIVGLSNYGWNEQLNLEIGRKIRNMYPDTLIVTGGPNIDTGQERRLEYLKKHDYVDLLVIDGGEEPFSGLIRWLNDTPGDFSQLPNNFVWREGDSVFAADLNPLKKDIDNIPSPYLAGYLDEFLHAGFVPLLETNRGCPFSCTFCAWGAAAKNRVGRFDLETVLKEVAHIGEHAKGAPNWIICDANFGMLPRDVKIAHAIRRVKDETGFPHKCHLWLAKNVTERNLQVADILMEMIVPVMAVQSMDDVVLKNVKRDNISKETYIEYNDKYKKLGSETFSELIVPLPGESLDTHKSSLRSLFKYGCDIIFNHNLRLLAGTEVNSDKTKDEFQFRSRYRLIHGDAGIYKCPDGTAVNAFEYENSLRETNTISEEEMFYLRKIHFLIEIAWNIRVYKPLLELARLYDVNPVDIFDGVIQYGEQADSTSNGIGTQVAEFFTDLGDFSRTEWFDSAEDIEAYFAKPENFERLMNQSYDKLNILYTVILLREYKAAFDDAFKQVLSSFQKIPEELIDGVAGYTFALFPSLATKDRTWNPAKLEIADDTVAELLRQFPHLTEDSLEFFENEQRQEMVNIVNTRGQTLSKVLNMRGFGALALRDLKMSVKEAYDYDGQFRRSGTKTEVSS